MLFAFFHFLKSGFSFLACCENRAGFRRRLTADQRHRVRIEIAATGSAFDPLGLAVSFAIEARDDNWIVAALGYFEAVLTYRGRLATICSRSRRRAT